MAGLAKLGEQREVLVITLEVIAGEARGHRDPALFLPQ